MNSFLDLKKKPKTKPKTNEKQTIFRFGFLTCYHSFHHQGVFSAVVGGKRRQQADGEERPKNKRSRQMGKDEEFYIPYKPKDFESERG